MKAIKNYTSKIAIDKIFNLISQILSDHGARKISWDMVEGKVQGVSFVIETNTRLIEVKLPARVEKAQTLLKKQYEAELIPRKERRVLEPEQAYRVAWRNILDWLAAQMALVDIEMVKMEEIFLPYMVSTNGQTLFEHLEAHQFQLEAGGK